MIRCCICIEDLKNDMGECELQPDLNHISCIPNLSSANYITKNNTDSQGSLTMSSLRVSALSRSSLKVLSMSLTLTRFSHKVAFVSPSLKTMTASSLLRRLRFAQVQKRLETIA